MSTLYVVSTPIGNLADLTRRAAEVLAEVDAILAEDTRRTSILLQHLELRTPLLSLHEHNEVNRAAQVLERLEAGDTLALVSDAGTPLVSDPGHRLVAAVVEAGHRVLPVPGPSAVLAALAASGLPPVPFAFLGFPPRKGPERKRLLERVAQASETTVLFEAPGRLVGLLEDLEKACGADRPVAVARELSKVHEEIRRGTLADARGYYTGTPPRGEVTLVVGPGGGTEDGDRVGDDETARALGRSLLAEGERPSRAAREVARQVGIPRNRAYRIVLSLAEGGEGTAEGS